MFETLPPKTPLRSIEWFISKAVGLIVVGHCFLRRSPRRCKKCFRFWPQYQRRKGWNSSWESWQSTKDQIENHLSNNKWGALGRISVSIFSRSIDVDSCKNSLYVRCCLPEDLNLCLCENTEDLPRRQRSRALSQGDWEVEKPNKCDRCEEV